MHAGIAARNAIYRTEGRKTMQNPDVIYKANYMCVGVEGGYRFRYFCALCNWHYETVQISAVSEKEARIIAEQEARRHFNGCHKCGRWICEQHYNVDEMMCIKCAPLAAKPMRIDETTRIYTVATT